MNETKIDTLSEHLMSEFNMMNVRVSAAETVFLNTPEKKVGRSKQVYEELLARIQLCEQLQGLLDKVLPCYDAKMGQRAYESVFGFFKNLQDNVVAYKDFRKFSRSAQSQNHQTRICGLLDNYDVEMRKEVCDAYALTLSIMGIANAYYDYFIAYRQTFVVNTPPPKVERVGA